MHIYLIRVVYSYKYIQENKREARYLKIIKVEKFTNLKADAFRNYVLKELVVKNYIVYINESTYLQCVLNHANVKYLNISYFDKELEELNSFYQKLGDEGKIVVSENSNFNIGEDHQKNALMLAIKELGGFLVANSYIASEYYFLM